MPFKDPKKRKEYNQEYYKRNYDSSKYKTEEQKKIHRDREKAYRALDHRKEKLAMYKQKRREDGTERDLYLKYTYGISLDDFNNMLTLQNNKCAICGNEFIKTPHVDHNHNTGQVRGLLCSCCNHALGLMKENAQTMQKMIDYTKRWNNG